MDLEQLVKDFDKILDGMTNEDLMQEFEAMGCVFDRDSLPKTFFRVCNIDSEQGLWYDFSGKFTGLIHTEFSFCSNTELPMNYDDELVGWLSATASLEELTKWFTDEDVLKLQDRGWFIHEYIAERWKFYDKFQHYVICQKTSTPIHRYIKTAESLSYIPIITL